MNSNIKMPLIVILTIALFSCDKKAIDVDIDIRSINISLTEDLDINTKPVCLKLHISSDEKFDNTYLLEQVVSIRDTDILIEIENIKNIGKCEYPQYLSAPEPENYKCPASTNYFELDNLARGLYNIKIIILEDTYYGRLKIQDQQASLIFNDCNIYMYDSVIHIIPDSCIFGTYYSMNFDSVGFHGMINKLQQENCRQISIEPGIYHDFEVDNFGKIIFNSTMTNPGSNFILKYDLDIDNIIGVLNDLVTYSNDAYCIIFKDNLGNNYNIKRPQ